MRTLDATFLAALENGSGLPIFYIHLKSVTATTLTDYFTFNVTQAVLGRTKVDLYVQENLLDNKITNTAGMYWIIKVYRGLTIAGTDYTVCTGWLTISEVSYSEQDGTHIVADMLPAASVVNIDGGQTAQAVIEDVFDQIFYPGLLTFDTSRDIWYSWQFDLTGKTLNLADARMLEDIIQNKYFAYFFQRGDYLHVYGIASNETNNEDGTYTPFGHARTTYFLTQDKQTNLSWFSDITYTEYAPDATVDYDSLNFISDADNPTLDPDFQNWSKVFAGVMYEYTQRPDLRLEQGDLLKVSTDGFSKVRCFEMIEVFKKGANPAWQQIVTQLPYHPKFIMKHRKAKESKGPESPITYTLPLVSPIPYSLPLETIIMSASFSGILSQNDSDIQQALSTIDLHEHDHGALSGLTDNDHTQYIRHALATAAGDFLVASASGTFVKKTWLQVMAIIAHDHNTAYEGSGGAVSYNILTNKPNVLSFASAWVRAVANSTTINQSFNVSSVVDTATGRMQVLFGTDFSSTAYVPLLTLRVSNTSTSVVVPAVEATTTGGYCYIEAWNVYPATKALKDPSAWALAAFGDQ